MQPGTEKKNDCQKLEIQQVQIRKEGKFASVNYRMPVSQLRICLPKKYMQSVSSDARNGKKSLLKCLKCGFFFGIFKCVHENCPKELKLNRCCNEKGVS